MVSVQVGAGQHRHDVLIGSGLLANAGDLIKERLGGPRCAIISDTNVASHYADSVKQSLTSSGFEPALITILAGEESKSLAQVGRICNQMTDAGLDRQSFVVGLGGGMIGDLAGFVAAIYHRGIPQVQIPTTLLAMVDSSIGGKTGVNTSAGKNLIGAIHYPSLVIDDVDLLQTLPRREFNQGFAEIIKHGIIADAEMFAALEDVDPGKLEPLIHRNIEIKSKIVAKDSLDRTGERALLNFGHTIGHAIERAGNYRDFFHGEAVSLGIVAAAAISVKKAGLPREQYDAIVNLLSAFELPTQLPPDFPREKILETLLFDKKFEAGKIRFVLTSKIGSARLSGEVTMEDMREAVNEL